MRTRVKEVEVNGRKSIRKESIATFSDWLDASDRKSLWDIGNAITKNERHQVAKLLSTLKIG